MKIQTWKVIDCQEWDRVVSKTYGRPYRLQQQDGFRARGVLHIVVPDEEAWDFENDTVPEVVNHEEQGVSFKAWLARDPKQTLPGRDDTFGLDLWWNRNFYPSLTVVANDLYDRGAIEAGEYAINIDW